MFAWTLLRDVNLKSCLSLSLKIAKRCCCTGLNVCSVNCFQQCNRICCLLKILPRVLNMVLQRKQTLTRGMRTSALTPVMLNKLRCHAHFYFQSIRLLDPGCWYKFTYLMANSADPDQLASSEANWSGSILFAKAEYIRSIRCHIRCHTHF